MALCSEYPEGNERVKASILFTVGCCHQQVKQNSQATQAFEETIEPLRQALAREMHLCKHPLQDVSAATNEDLLKPSIFDSDQVKELRLILQDVLSKLEETREQDTIN